VLNRTVIQVIDSTALSKIKETQDAVLSTMTQALIFFDNQEVANERLVMTA
jgi:hypothetical protein